MQHPVLLVIDIQRGAFDGARIKPIAEPDRLVGNAGRLVEAAREGGAPIVFIQHGDEAGQAFEEGTPHWEFHEALRPQAGRAGESALGKRASSAFEGTDLAARLQALKARTLVVCGLQSEFCVSNTTRSALAEGFTVLVAADAHSTWPTERDTAAAVIAQVNSDLQAAGATLAGTDQLASLLRQPA